MKWISVNDSMPEEDSQVFAYRKSYWSPIIFAAVSSDDSGDSIWYNWETEKDMEEEITHWMPLPPTPENID